ncbi:MAG: hypothetical protein Q8Q09_24855 [Deltaproteobacteria bacterium]|nr:hypothetical protein [Deltaproteobacteria bacterium]
MGISMRRMRTLVVDGETWLWSPGGYYSGNTVMTPDKRTIADFGAIGWGGALSRIRVLVGEVRNVVGATRRGPLVLQSPVAMELLEGWYPSTATAVIRWLRSDELKNEFIQPIQPQNTVDLGEPIAQWGQLLGRYDLDHDGPARAVIEAHLGHVVMSWDLERVSAQTTAQEVAQCFELLAARGAIELDVLTDETRRFGPERSRVPERFQDLWAFAMDPDRARTAEALAREAQDRLARGLASSGDTEVVVGWVGLWVDAKGQLDVSGVEAEVDLGWLLRLAGRHFGHGESPVTEARLRDAVRALGGQEEPLARTAAGVWLCDQAWRALCERGGRWPDRDWISPTLRGTELREEDNPYAPMVELLGLGYDVVWADEAGVTLGARVQRTLS